VIKTYNSSKLHNIWRSAIWLKGINHATVLPLDIFTFTLLSAEIGFEGVEYRIPKIIEVAKAGSFDDLKRLVKRCSINVISLNTIENFSLITEEEFKKLQKETEYILSLGRELGCKLVIAVPSPQTHAAIEKQLIIEKTAKRLTVLDKLASEYDTTIGFEFLGFNNISINNLREALNVLKKLMVRVLD